jgi:hypothetical protein
MSQEFEVYVSGSSTNVEEWRKAMAAQLSELPVLNEQQKDVARRFGVSEEEYRRGLLAGLYGEKRLWERGRDLGLLAQDVLGGLGTDYRVVAVQSRMIECRWIVRVKGPDKVVNLSFSRELVDDALDSHSTEQMDRIRRGILEGLGRTELLTKQ